MLPRRYRLSLKTRFSYLKKRGRLFPGRFFALLVNHGPEERRPNVFPQFAFIISRKIHRHASKRNRIKRLLHEAVWRLLPKIKEGEIVIFTRKPIIDSSFEKIKRELEMLLDKACCLQK